ncbi:MAG: hypothetical protein NTX25_05800 [Proteobacteria bacterium]|nr:hypothetical protein [Pseudomonadota bacterium]
MSRSSFYKLIFACSGLASAATGFGAEMYKTVNVSLPIISFGRESVAKAEFNLHGQGSIGVELNVMGQSEIYSDKEVEEKNGDSLMMKGSQLAILYSRFGNPKMLSGGYWSLGAGYRQVQADWQETPKLTQDIQSISLNSDGKMSHNIEGAGMTAHARTGYRYVAESVPFSVGAYLGMRHFQNKMRDTDKEGAVPTNSADLEALQRRLTSRLETGVEIGLAF